MDRADEDPGLLLALEVLGHEPARLLEAGPSIRSGSEMKDDDRALAGR